MRTRLAYRSAAVGSAIIVLTGACSVSKYPTVRITPFEADIVFGVKPPEAPSLPVAVPIVPQQAVEAPPPPPVESPSIELPNLPPLELTPPPSDCPAAALDAFPDQTAPIDSKGLPRVGQYRWKQDGAVTQGSARVPVTGFQQRLLRRVTPIPKLPTDNADSRDFTFQQVEPYGTQGSVLVLSFQVRSDVASQRFIQPQNGTSANLYQGSPDAGLALTAEDVVDRAGNSVPLFHPSAPLLLLPLPINPGASFSSVAEDSANGRVVSVQGQVTRRARVDACGTIIEGWQVTGTENVSGTGRGPAGAPSSAGAAQVNFTDLYATQYGAMPLEEHIVESPSSPAGSSSAPTSDVDYTIGQRDPSPLPAGTS